jgi:hypothetical protein
VSQWRDPCQVFWLYVFVGMAQLFDNARKLHGVPDQDGVGQQAQGADLVHDFLVIVGSREKAYPVGA